jgi:adenosylcobyric acid synthase
VQGYEIHLGISQGPALQQPAAWLQPVEEGVAPRPDGALSADGQVLGSYVHGLFDDPQAQAALLRWAGLRDAAAVDLAALREASLDRLADVLEEHLDADALWRVMGACSGG